MTAKKHILVVYHSQGGTMERMARRFTIGAAKEQNIEVVFKKAGETTAEDVLACHGIAIGSPEYFGTMAGMIKDFFDRTYEPCHEKKRGLPYVVFVCAGNDGRGAIAQIDRLVAGYNWQQVLAPLRVVGASTEQDLEAVEELGQTMAAGIDFGIF